MAESARHQGWGTGMTASKSPEFGPNGAVMNGPHMTDGMRDRIERNDPRHPSNQLPRSMQWLFAGVSIVGLALVFGAGVLRDDQPGIALALALCGVVVTLANLAWRALVLRYLRSRAS
jgi:hypothetical protein